jgi:hypothetical protein
LAGGDLPGTVLLSFLLVVVVVVVVVGESNESEFVYYRQAIL